MAAACDIDFFVCRLCLQDQRIGGQQDTRMGMQAVVGDSQIAIAGFVNPHPGLEKATPRRRVQALNSGHNAADGQTSVLATAEEDGGARPMKWNIPGGDFR